MSNEDSIKDWNNNIDLFRRWIHIPHWKNCWKIGYCEKCEEEYLEFKRQGIGVIDE